VGVIDILPGCISSVYLYYDPEYSFLNLGVYSALNEIAMVRKFNRILHDLKYYYMGYYIHQCPKMRYKAKYLPSDLLCSETNRWFSIESCVKKLDKNKYARFCDDQTVQDDDGSSFIDCDIKVLFKKMALNYRDYKRLTKNNDDQEKIYEYVRLVGRKCASSLLYYIDNSD
ncbi:arginyl-tRNA-protein transferase 1-like protein, partial [Euroglyphus maynei]